MSAQLIKYVLTAALRDRLALSLLVFVIVMACLSVFLGSSSVIEADQFALVFVGGSLRIAGVIGLILFAVFYIRRCFDNKDVEFLLSRPISRASFIFSHAAAFSILSVFIAITVFLTICLIAPHSIGAGHGLWFVSLLVEYIIITNVAFFFSMVLTSSVSSTLAVFGLYAMARMMGTLLGIADEGIRYTSLEAAGILFQIVSIIVPRLDLMAQTSWLLYGVGADNSVSYIFILLQGIVFVPLVLCAALIDLKRRQF
jgi:ABC-type transport system involved in multi-copper enzyme maturation permease subunit